MDYQQLDPQQLNQQQLDQQQLDRQQLKSVPSPGHDQITPKFETLNSSLSTTKHLPNHGLSLGQLRLVFNFINDYLGNEIRLEELAALTHSSPSHFTKQFKHATGLPPHQYLIQQRVERAKELLGSGDIRIAEVSQVVGFFDQSHLVRHFKYWVGVTPRDYRDSRLKN